MKSVRLCYEDLAIRVVLMHFTCSPTRLQASIWLQATRTIHRPMAARIDRPTECSKDDGAKLRHRTVNLIDSLLLRYAVFNCMHTVVRHCVLV